MSFRYFNRTAIDEDLGILVQRDARAWDDDLAGLVVSAMPEDKAWRFLLYIESEWRPYLSPRGPSTRKVDVRFLLSRRQIGEVARELAKLKETSGVKLSHDDWLEVIRQGVFCLKTAGGKFLEYTPDISVAFKA